MKWPFTVTDPISPFYLVLLKFLDAITTFVILYNDHIFDLAEQNQTALYLFNKIGFAPSIILYSFLVYGLGVFIRSYYYSNWKYRKNGAEFCYNVYVFVLIGVPIWNYYKVVESWWFWYIL